MAENDYLNEYSDEINLEFVEREATPRLLMRLSIQLHLAGLSLSNDEVLARLDRQEAEIECLRNIINGIAHAVGDFSVNDRCGHCRECYLRPPR